MKLFLLFHKHQPIYLNVLDIPLINKTHISDLCFKMFCVLKTPQQWTFGSRVLLNPSTTRPLTTYTPNYRPPDPLTQSRYSFYTTQTQLGKYKTCLGLLSRKF